jgi:serine/threonine protein kinase
MKFANAVNSLVVTFIRLDFDEHNNWDFFVMERLHAIDYRSYEIEKRELWMDVLEHEVQLLHTAGFVHRDIKRP